MRDITELTLLLRGSVTLPDDLKLETEEFLEGWSFVQSGDRRWLDKKIRRRGWHFIRIAEGLLGSGVGQTSQEAIGSALKLALRHVSERFNAAEIGHIELKKYPWFLIAKVTVDPYQVQQRAVPPVSDSSATLWMPPPAKAVTVAGNQVVSAV